MVTMRAPSFIRSLSSKLSMGRRCVCPAVVPVLLEHGRFSQEVVNVLCTLQSSEHDVGCASWLVDVLDATIATQKMAHESLTKEDSSNISVYDKELIEDYLDDNVEVLDVCNIVLDKMDAIQKYVASLKATTKFLCSGVLFSLNQCEKLEKECVALDKRGPKLCRLMGRKSSKSSTSQANLELNEVVSTSKEVALVTCYRLQRALSFKSKKSLMRVKSNISTNWSISLNGAQIVTTEEVETRKQCSPNSMLNELEDVVKVFRTLRGQEKCGKVNVDVDLVRKSCEALEEGMRPLEEKVRELYKYLISIRMELLGILSRN